ncbi:MAG: hypothetical protein AAF251_05735 [Pseudomonadota bacterium]
MIEALLLAASSPEQFGTSPLVDPPHEHEWQVLVDENGGKVWWDKKPTGKALVNGVEYPKIIVRQVPEKGDWLSEVFTYVDAAWAVDCSTGQLAPFGEAADGKQLEPWVGHAPTPRFRSMPEMEMVSVQEVMRAVCGEGWNK